MKIEWSRTDGTYDRLLSGRRVWTIPIFQFVLLFVAYLIGHLCDLDRNAEVLGVIWQVHATFASVGFAGLAIAFQVLGDPPLAAGSARGSVISALRFTQLLTQGVVTSSVLGLTVIAVPNLASAGLAFGLVLIPSIAAVAIAYGRLGRLYVSTERLEALTLADLDLRIEEVARAASERERLDEECSLRLSSLRGVTTVSLRRGTNQGAIRQFRFQGATGVVGTVKSGPLVHAADNLASFALEATAREALYSYDYESRIAILVRDGQLIRQGDVLFEANDLNGVSEAGWASIVRLVDKALGIMPDDGSDPQRQFAREMSSLQDAVLSGVVGGQLERVRRGYKYFDRVVDHAKHSVSSSSGAFHENRWFSLHLWEIDDAAASQSPRLALVAIEAAQSRSYVALKMDDVDMLETTHGRLRHLWNVVQELPGSGGEGARENLLIGVQNFTEFALPTMAAANFPQRDAFRLTVATFTEFARSSYSWGDLETARRVLGYSTLLADLGPAANADFDTDVGAGAAAVLAWNLYCRDTRRSPVPLEMSDFPVRHRIPDAIAVLRTISRDSDWSPWRWWESERSLPFQLHASQFHRHLQKAVLLLVASGHLRLRPKNASEVDLHLIREVLSVAPSCSELWPPGSAQQESLKRAVEEFRETERILEMQHLEETIQAPVDDELWREFLLGIERATVSRPGLFEFLSLRSDASYAEFDRRLLGSDYIVPKDFFLRNDVMADPGSLGETFGRAALAARDRAVLDLLASNGFSISSDRVDLSAAVGFFAKQCDDPVLIYFGEPGIEEVLGVDHESETPDLAGLPAYALYDAYERLDHLVLVDRQKLPQARLTAEEKEGLTNAGEAKIAAGYFPLLEAEEGDVEDPSVRIETGQWIEWSEADLTSSVFFRVPNL